MKTHYRSRNEMKKFEFQDCLNLIGLLIERSSAVQFCAINCLACTEGHDKATEQAYEINCQAIKTRNEILVHRME